MYKNERKERINILRQIRILLYIVLLSLFFIPKDILANETQSLTVLFTGDLKGWVTQVPV
jgi:hypothetical protein